MTKVNGSLGFTLRKEDHSALGHYVRALVREPALSDGRIQPGDRIVAVSIFDTFIALVLQMYWGIMHSEMNGLLFASQPPATVRFNLKTESML